MFGDVIRILAGGILTIMGIVLFAMALGGVGLASLAGLLLAVSWAAAGIAVLAGKPWGRVLGLVVSLVGLAVGVSLATGGTESPLARGFFSAADAARWYVVMPTGYACAILSAIAGLLLIPPFGPWVRGDDQSISADPMQDDASDR